MRLGAQSSAAALSTLILLALIGVDQTFLGVISAVLVLDPSRDATIGNALQRIVATVIGTIVGGAGLLLSPQGQITSVAIVMLLMGSLAAVRPQWRYGLVAAAGLAIGAETELWQTAFDRTVAIFVGAGAGIAAGLLIWPKTSRRFAVEHLGEALATCNRLLKRTIALAVEESEAELSELHQKFIRQIERASSAAGSMRLARGREKHLIEEAIHQSERLWHALIILDRVSETKSRSTIIAQRQGQQVRKLKQQCCDALSCLERLEPVAPECLDSIDRSGIELDLLRPDEGDPDRIERLGLTYGLHEVVRNIRELSEAIGNLQTRASRQGR